MKKNKIIIVVSLILMFIANTIVVLADGYRAIDGAVRLFIMRYASEMTNKAMHIITFFGSTTGVVIICALIFFVLLLKKKNVKAYSMAGMLIVSTIINTVIKLIIRRERPEYIAVVEHSFSYPSGHTMASATMYGFMIYLILRSEIPKKYKNIFSSLLAVLILLVGISRIYLGAHFFSDVFGSMLLSATLIIIFDIINDKKKII